MSTFRDRLIGRSEDHEQLLRRINGRRTELVISLLIVSAIFLITFFAVVYSPHDQHGPGFTSGVIKPVTPSYIHLCKQSRYPEFCISSLSAYHHADDSVSQNIMQDTTNSHVGLVGKSMRTAVKGLSELHSLSAAALHASTNASAETPSSAREVLALRDCAELLGDAVDLMIRALEELRRSEHREMFPSEESLVDIQTWVSAALTYHTTCMDELMGAVTVGKVLHAENLKREGDSAEKLLSIALTFLVSLFSSPLEKSSLKYVTAPTWLDDPKDKVWLVEDGVAAAADCVVSASGDGRYTKIQDAVNAAPKKSKQRYTIYVKQGVYMETLDISKYTTNLMLIGDGIGKTIISGSKNVDDGASTFTSATVAVTGDGFLARDITIRNTAGAAKHQAVALRVGADRVAFYRCSFEGYQDTLYTHSQRQFYRNCLISGTVDYIFGNAAALFQDSTLLGRIPLLGQQNTYTAQGRTDSNQNTGLVFQACTIDGEPALQQAIQSYPTYLGRPWKEYSRTVFLKSYEGSVINPAGWLEWSRDFALKTLFYGEYQCIGPGADPARRVTWSTQIHDPKVADQFSCGKFVSGDQWLPSTSFPFDV